MAVVESRVVGKTLVMALNRPERRNALTKEQLRHLVAELRRIGHGTHDLLGVVVTGTEGCFCAGMDVAEVTGTATDEVIDHLLHEWTMAVETLPVPVVAAVEGPCVGAGLDLALSTDMIIASESAVFNLPAVHLGLLYRPLVVAELLQGIGAQAAARILLFGDRVTAREAACIGLVSEVVEAGHAVDRAMELANGLERAVRGAVAATKALLRGLRRGELDLERWSEVARRLAASEERRSAVAAARARLLGGA
ncbi:MAG: enoyl-CoA hydratase/isomerase family protein [Armatimonadota bacterium]|nr:enoyl-CoA hydratase/isomerase family protein [Armatimonadota bacterium]